MKHTCHARGCEKPCPPKHLMCRPHWFMVPKPLRDAVWAAYRPGQERDKQPSAEWHEAADAAIRRVAELERQLGCCVEESCDPSTCMQLPPGATCGGCLHLLRCEGLGIVDEPQRAQCDWFPRRYEEAPDARP